MTRSRLVGSPLVAKQLSAAFHWLGDAGLADNPLRGHLFLSVFTTYYPRANAYIRTSARSSAHILYMVLEGIRIGLNMGHAIPASVIYPTTSATLGGKMDYSAVVVDGIDATRTSPRNHVVQAETQTNGRRKLLKHPRGLPLNLLLISGKVLMCDTLTNGYYWRDASAIGSKAWGGTTVGDTEGQRDHRMISQKDFVAHCTRYILDLDRLIPTHIRQPRPCLSVSRHFSTELGCAHFPKWS
ncbi:hypothetical protein BDM02DRAFT_3128764 [Thelephora ganbajun]|uniref:Uncharacterized protein n=1 Tax=Thelephora ganbajun TaxID=370292 RepID=A0ACB6ZGW0_THEGA|nr:hypothetical protein BDM02DRAFT_3128764 [Thelephora ganbajun]